MNLESTQEALLENRDRGIWEGRWFQGSWSDQLRLVSAASVLTEFTVDVVISCALLWNMNLLVLSFPLKVHSYTH